MNETPTPPEGYRLLTDEEKKLPLPMDTLVLWGEHWEPSTLRGRKITLSSDFGNIYATAQPLPCFQKGGDEPCPPYAPSAEATTQSVPHVAVGRNAPVAVQSPDQGPEHNPDGLTPEQYGAPVYRLLREGEKVAATDEIYDTRCQSNKWVACEFGNSWIQLEARHTTASYRRRVAPEPAAPTVHPDTVARFAEIDAAEKRIAELEREVESVRHCGNEERRRLTKECDEAKSEREKAIQAVISFNIMKSKGHLDAEAEVERLRAQLAASEKALKLASTTMLKSMQHHGCDPCHLTEAIAAIDEAMKEAK